MDIKKHIEYLKSNYGFDSYVELQDERDTVDSLVKFFSKDILDIEPNDNLHLTILKFLRIRADKDITRFSGMELSKKYIKALNLNPNIETNNGAIQMIVRFLSLKGIITFKSSINWWWITELGTIYLDILESWYKFKYIETGES